MSAQRLARLAAIVAVVLALILTPTPPARAATLRDVMPGGTDSGDCAAVPCRSIAYALGQAASGDTIQVAAGTYAEHLTIAKNVTLQGAGAATILDGNNTGRVVDIPSGVTVAVQGVTIRGGNGAFDGGGLRNAGTLTVAGSTISGNTASYGGGVLNNGTAELIQSTISGNTATSHGGGVENNGTLTLVASIVSGNAGAGVGNVYGTLTVDSSTISGNTASAGGGVNNYGGQLAITGSTVSGNSASETGGGISNYAGSATLTNSTVSGNSASTGGGVSNFRPETIGGTLTLINSTISGNSATSLGGGVSNFAGAMAFTYSTLSGNTAPAAAGVSNDSSYFSDGTLALTGTILANSTGDNCGGAAGTITSLGHTLASDASCSLGATGDRPDTDPLLAPLADNGGPTWTHKPRLGSLAIDGGPAAGCPGSDQRGVSRPQGAACDVGAVEVEAPRATLSAGGLSFGEQPVGTTSAPQSVTLTNSGAAALAIAGVVAGGEFTQVNTCGTGLPPGTSCTITVTFAPTAVGRRDALLSIANNAAGSPHTVALSGSGTAPPSPPTYTLTLSASGGGTAGGGGAYSAGTVATLTATPAPGSLFLGWAVDGQPAGWANPLTLTMNANHTAVATFAPRPAFPDVTPATTGATEPIAQLAARGVIKGYQDGTFGPADPTLRAQMAALIVRAMGWGAEDPPNPFSDRNGVDDELWRDVAILAAHNVAKGYGDGTYGTTDDVLNAQVISFITRAMVDKGDWQFQPDDGSLYPNVPAASGHRQDLATYVHYAGPVRGAANVNAAFAGWDRPSSRAWFAFALWQALDSHFGADWTP